MISKKRLLSTIIALVTITSATSCSKNKQAISMVSNVNAESVIESSIDVPLESNEVNQNLSYDILDSFNDESKEEQTKNEVIEENISNEEVSLEIVKENTSNEIVKTEDYPISLLNANLYTIDINYQDVIRTYLETDYSEREQLDLNYIKALYMLLYNTNIPMTNYLKELNTMAIMQQIPTCVPEDIWNKEFANLLTNFDYENESLFEKFGPLAYYVHVLKCEEEHNLNIYGGYTCPNLDKELKLELIKDTDLN